jgi:TATA-box binding protein (TBP) (component of TFIID and TFIIIB)
MCSVARLSRSHAEVQREHVREAYRAYHDLFDFSLPVDLPPDEYRRQSAARAEACPFSVRPAEGWLPRRWAKFDPDPMLTGRTFHDVVPREILRAADPGCTDHSGTARICREVAAIARRRLDEYGLLERARDGRQPLHEHFTVRDNMQVHVVNIVHTSYCTTSTGSEEAPPDDESARGGGGKILFTNAWQWRRCGFLGCQENHTYTSLKISYKPPFKASELLFSSGRVLETGSANEDVSHVMLFDVTLEYMRRAGMPRLRVRKRSSQNVVAKSNMPGGQSLLLDLLQTRMQEQVTYEPGSFAGAVIRHLSLRKVMMLAFSVGSIVCVGPTDVPAMRAAFDSLYDTLQNHVDTPANRAILDRYRGGPAQARAPAPRGRKRARVEVEEEEDAVHSLTLVD